MEDEAIDCLLKGKLILYLVKTKLLSSAPEWTSRSSRQLYKDFPSALEIEAPKNFMTRRMIKFQT